MIDRIKGPKINPVRVSTFPKYEKIILKNGLPLYIVNAGTQNIFKIDLLVSSGRRYETKPGVARMCAALLKEATTHKSALELSELWDYYGAMLSSSSDLDTAGLSLSGLNKYAEKLIPDWTSLLNDSFFDAEELEHRKKLFADKLTRELSKNDVVAYRHFTELMYEKDHFYGYNTTAQDYLNIERQDLVDHYEQYWGANRASILLSGKIDDKLKLFAIEAFQNIKVASVEKQEEELLPYTQFRNNKKEQLTTENKLQAAIKIGHSTIHRTDPNYTALYFLVQILGGYFGCRLMKKLREEKGLCYNIYASIDRLRSSNYLYVSAEVDSEKIEESLQAIHQEIKILQTELISEEEIQMVKSYISGKIMAGLDGPFRSSQLLKSYLSHELHFDYFCAFNDELETITPELLMKMANEHLNWSEMTQVIVGP